VSERRSPSLEELEGFRAGIAHALSIKRTEGTADEQAERSLREADRLLSERRLPEAERALLAIDRRVRRSTPERELAEYPRGLLSYTPTDGPESPTPPEEDALRNRLLLLRKLATVRASQGRPVEGILRTLSDAERVLDAGDRVLAKRLGEAAHAELESAASDPAGTRASARLREA
jgi:hypothetical protein